VQDIDEVLAEAKNRRKRAEGDEAADNLAQELGYENKAAMLAQSAGDGKHEVSAYEKAADTITGGLHKVEEAKAVLQHANIPSKVVAPVLEIIITTEAMIEEFALFAGIDKKTKKAIRGRKSTLDPLTLEENRLLVEESIRIMEAIPILLTAKDGFRSIQAVENLKSLVTGESIMRANEAGAFATGQSRGIVGAIKGLFVGKK